MGETEIKTSDQILTELNKQFMQSPEFKRLIEDAKQAGRNEIINQQFNEKCPLAAIELCPTRDFSVKCIKCHSLNEIISRVPENDKFIAKIAEDLIFNEKKEMKSGFYDEFKDLFGDADEMFEDFFKYIYMALEKQKQSEPLTSKELLLQMAAASFAEEINGNNLTIKIAKQNFIATNNSKLKDVLLDDEDIVDEEEITPKPIPVLEENEEQPDLQSTEQIKFEDDE